MKLAIFDVDYTLTSKESLMEFYKYMIKKDRLNIKYLPRAVFSGLMYVSGVYDEKKTKETFLEFMRGYSREDIDELAEEFYSEHLNKLLYKDAIKELKRVKAEGYKVILISASPHFYIKEFAKMDEVDAAFGTMFKFKDNRFTSEVDGVNCKGVQKVALLLDYLKVSGINANFKESLMYSDSLSDAPLLDLVGNPYIINYKKETAYNKLKWS